MGFDDCLAGDESASETPIHPSRIRLDSFLRQSHMAHLSVMPIHRHKNAYAGNFSPEMMSVKRNQFIHRTYQQIVKQMIVCGLPRDTNNGILKFVRVCV